MSTFSIVRTAIDPECEMRFLEASQCGACVSFEGWVRDHSGGLKVQHLEYEVFEELALKEGQRIVEEAVGRFRIEKVRCIHRVGSLRIGDIAVWIGVSGGHREETFAACRYVIDEVKLRVPIWKKEYDTAGKAEWVNSLAAGS